MAENMFCKTCDKHRNVGNANVQADPDNVKKTIVQGECPVCSSSLRMIKIDMQRK